MSDIEILQSLLVALGIGVLIGIERGWRGREESEGGRPAGLRTFSIIGFIGGLTGVLAHELGPLVFALVFVSVAALLIAGYILSSRGTDVDKGFTTEVAALSVFLLGAVASFGYLAIAAAGAVVMVTLLGFKPALHAWVARLEREELLASLKLLLIALVALPLLPNETYGPWDTFNPFEIGWMVVLIAAISYVGYLGVKIAGTTRGLSITAVFGGLASSTAVALSFSRLATTHQTLQYILAAGVVMASSIMFPRIALEVSVVNIKLLPQLIMPLTLMFLVSLLTAWHLWRTHAERITSSQQPTLKNPFELLPALQFGLLLALVMFLSKGMLVIGGEQGIYVLALLSGIVDVDAITLSLSRLAREELSQVTAVHGIVLAAVSNTAFKFTLFILLTRGPVARRLIITLVLTLLAGLLGIWLNQFMTWPY